MIYGAIFGLILTSGMSGSSKERDYSRKIRKSISTSQQSQTDVNTSESKDRKK